jgi:hypothetical protein
VSNCEALNPPTSPSHAPQLPRQTFPLVPPVPALAQHGKIPAYNLEKVLGNYHRAVKIRRALICESYVHLPFVRLLIVGW